MQCYNCKTAIPDGSIYCPRCGARFAVPPPSVQYVQYVQYQTPQYQFPPVPLKSRSAYVILAILFGGLGIHNFYAGRGGCGVTQLLLSLFTCGLCTLPMYIWALFEALIVSRDGLGREMKPMSIVAMIFAVLLFFTIFILPWLMLLFLAIIGAILD